jgi:hypothetical protein
MPAAAELLPAVFFLYVDVWIFVRYILLRETEVEGIEKQSSRKKAHRHCIVWIYEVSLNNKLKKGSIYEGESNEKRKNLFKFNLYNESGTQLYHFST